MMKRLSWFVGGVAAGAAGAGYAKKKVKHTAAQLAPVNVAKRAAGSIRDQGRHVVDAIREGRTAMHSKEDELRARRDARVETLDDRLEPGDQLLVDGRPVETGRVIVLKQKQ
jgi:hypothetical protein